MLFSALPRFGIYMRIFMYIHMFVMFVVIVMPMHMYIWFYPTVIECMMKSAMAGAYMIE